MLTDTQLHNAVETGGRVYTVVERYEVQTKDPNPAKDEIGWSESYIVIRENGGAREQHIMRVDSLDKYKLGAQVQLSVNVIGTTH